MTDPTTDQDALAVTETTSRLLYFGVGEFAAHLLRHRRVPAEDIVSTHGLETAGRAGDTLVVVHDGAATDLRDAVDRSAAARGVSTVGVQLLPSRIVCGPAVVPGSTACWLCHRKRAAQHAGGSHEFDVDASVSDLPEGFGAPHVLLASGLLDLALDEIDARRRATGTSDGVAVTAGSGLGSGLGGTVRTVNLVSGAVSSAATVATDRCPRCGDRFASRRSDAAVATFPELAPRG
jgi:hypothetical protein